MHVNVKNPGIISVIDSVETNKSIFCDSNVLWRAKEQDIPPQNPHTNIDAWKHLFDAFDMIFPCRENPECDLLTLVSAPF